MKKKLLTLFGVVLLFASCNFPTKEEIHTPSRGQIITFSLGTGNSKVVTYSQQIHDENEYKINRIDIFEFDKDADGKYYLKEIYKNHSGLSAVTTTNPAKRTVSQIVLPKGTTGTKKFFFVANMADPGDAALQNSKLAEDLTALQKTTGDNKGTEFETVKNKLTVALSQQENLNLSHPFLMTGEAEIQISADNGGAPIDAEVMLTRNVARLDVAISLVEKEEILTINKIEFQNLPDKAYLLPSVKTPGDNSSAFMAPEGFSQLNYKVYDSEALKKHFDDQPTNYYQSRYKQLYYFYELSKEQFNGKAPTVIISGEYQKNASASKVKVRYIIPFDRDIKRNHIYTVVLGVKRVPGPDGGGTTPALNPDEDKYEAAATINTLKWEDEETITHDMSLITLKSKTGQDSKYTFDPVTHIISVKSGDRLEEPEAFDVKSVFSGDDDDLVEVVKADPDGNVSFPNNYWFSLEPSAGKLKLTVEANNEIGERKGMVWLKTKNSNGYHYLVIVHQPKKKLTIP